MTQALDAAALAWVKPSEIASIAPVVIMDEDMVGSCLGCSV